MDLLQNLATGFAVALSAQTLLFCLVGVTVGMIVGVLPGIGPLAAIAMLLPLTYYQTPTDALVMLAGIFYGTQYGGGITAILLNLPGTASSAVVCLDGNPLARAGRGGPALFTSTIASFIGSTVTVLIVAAFAPPLARVGLAFDATAYFSVIALGLVAASTMMQGSVLKGIGMVLVGLLLGLAGTDINSGALRFTFGLPDLYEGYGLVPVAMGIFGLAEVTANVGRSNYAAFTGRISLRTLLPTRAEMRTLWMPILRGTGVGAAFGALPGTGTSIASFVAYGLEKRVAKRPERFGKGALEGVAAPESSNNAAAQSAFIPTLTLGIPGDAVMALMLGAMLIHGITPGPNVITKHPDLFWGLIASFWIGNLMLLVLNLPLLGVWVWLLRIPYKYLYPAVLIFICIGVYTIHYSVAEILLVAVFGIVGFGMRILGFEPTPLLLGYILGPLMEEYFRRALLISGGDLTTFITHPLSAVFLLLTLLLLVWSAVRAAVRNNGNEPVSDD